MDKLVLDKKLLDFKEYLDDVGVWYKNDYVIKYETYFKMGGVVKVFVCPQNISYLKDVIVYLNKHELKFKVIGLTTNILLLEKVSYSVLISTKNLLGVRVGDGEIEAECGYSLQDFVRVAVVAGSSGYEGLEGIPGSIGGAIFMNAGAYGYSISDNIVSVDCINVDGNILSLAKSECGFDYRKSAFQKNRCVILSAKFSLKAGKREEIGKHIEKYHIARHSYQEWVYPNLGSLFSVREGLYRYLFRRSIKYTFVYLFFRVMLKNSLAKFIFRKSPNNKIFNQLFDHYVGGLSLVPSIKSINILMNDGSSISKMYDYVMCLKGYYNNDAKLENEFITAPLYSIEEDFYDIFRLIKLNLSLDDLDY